MALPGVTQTIQDPGLGAIPANSGLAQVKLGVSNNAPPNVLQGLGTSGAAKAGLGNGPLLEAVMQVLDVAGGPAYAMPILPSVYGSFNGTTSFTNGGSGTATVVGSLGPEQIVKVKIIGGGTLTNATFQVAIGSGGYGATQTTAATYQVPGQYFTTLAFAAGTYVANDVYQLNLDGTVTRTGSGTSTLLNGSTHSPVDAYKIKVKVVTAGALGTAAFQYSLDNGNSWSGTILSPSSGIYPIPNTGVVLTLVGTFVLGDVYTNTALTGPGYASGDMVTAFTALRANSQQWGFVHVVGAAADAATAATLFTTIDGQMTSAEAAFRYAFAVMECPTTESDATVSAAFAAKASPRMMVCAGDVDLQSTVSGRIDRRNLAWNVTARMSQRKLSTDPGQVKDGPMKNVNALYRDEFATPALFDARFTTMRTYPGRNGYYCTAGLMMAAPGSDFGTVMNRRVMDRACAVSYNAYLNYVNASDRINQANGFIDERDARQMDAFVTAQMEAALTDQQECSAVNAVLSRTDNILSTSTINADVGIIPLGYSKFIKVNLGFKNPALAAA